MKKFSEYLKEAKLDLSPEENPVEISDSTYKKYLTVSQEYEKIFSLLRKDLNTDFTPQSSVAIKRFIDKAEDKFIKFNDSLGFKIEKYMDMVVKLQNKREAARKKIKNK